MSDYTPQDSARVLVTFPAIFAAGTDRYVVCRDWTPPAGEPGHLGGSAWFIPAELAVRVEPGPVELPTGFGARIRATVRCGCGDMALPAAGVKGVCLVRLISRGTIAVGSLGHHWRADLAGPVPCCGHIDYGDTALSDVGVLDLGESARTSDISEPETCGASDPSRSTRKTCVLPAGHLEEHSANLGGGSVAIWGNRRG